MVLRIANNSKLNKLIIQSLDIEISDKIDSSILNKHLDEILYFFEATDFDIVVFEDLDRFENTEIFTKLREINILLNNSKQINRRIVFIYAIKDYMFKDKNRTKFFDFIIPVIPIINISNSGEKLVQKLKDIQLIKIDTVDNKEDSNINKTEINAQLDNSARYLSQDFVIDISMFIDDMRLLNNIYNEFLIYRERLSHDLNLDKLLAIIVYKNIGAVLD